MKPFPAFLALILITASSTHAREKESCDGLSAKACHEHVAQAYAKLQGRVPESFSLFTSACKKGDASACAVYARFIKNRKVSGVSDYSAVFGKSRYDQLVKECEKSDDGFSCFEAASMRMEGIGADQSYTEALHYYDKGCSVGSLLACSNLGNFYFNGLGTEKSPSRAVEAFEKACSKGLGIGCFNLGRAYAVGSGVEKSTADAAKYYKKGCDGGFPIACAGLGLLYMQGDGIEKSETRGFELFMQSCRDNEPFACKCVGIAYRNGQGTEKSDAKAVEYYSKACELDPAQGCAQLAFSYVNGHGVEKNPGKAFELDQRGCESGDLASCTDLGNMYLRGEGVTASRDKAKELYDRSCKGHEPTACKNLEMLSRNDEANQQVLSAGLGVLSFISSIAPSTSVIARAGAHALKAVGAANGMGSCKPTGCSSGTPWFEGGNCYVDEAAACNGKPPGCKPLKCL